MPKVITAQEAVRQYIHNGSTVAFGGFVGAMVPEEIKMAIQEQYLNAGTPKALTIIYAAGQGDSSGKGLNHLGEEGLVERIIGGHWGLVPRLQKLALENKCAAYNYPQGVISHMFRDIAAGKPGVITHVGLKTFADPRLEGGMLNEKARQAGPLVELIEIGGREWLFYKAIPIDVAVVRATYADTKGNCTFQKEGVTAETLAICQAAKNSGGKVIVQVEHVVEYGALDTRLVRLPGIYVDAVVEAAPENHTQTFGTQYNPAYSGEIRVPVTSLKPMPLDQRKIVARRAAMELVPNAITNLGIGMPEGIAAIAAGEAGLVVGTHAVIGEGVQFKALGLAVVDEQHRFGVRQRGLLAGKAAQPHVLVMSATPIPRTLALLVYGDLDISVLDELPPGRKATKTYAVGGEKRKAMYGFLEKQIAAGRQVYIVCPLVEESDGENTGDLAAVTTYYTEVAKALLPGRRVGLMHGRLKAKEKAAVMEEFKAGKLDALVSTTVIEVGVDVPNATVMVIENAERYGLSALHQLRGRVGRGGAESFCILVSDHGSESVRDRLRFLCSTQDGFAIAKYDLEHRGPGDFFGDRQHGLPTLQLASLTTDTRTLAAAHASAAELLEADPALTAPEHRALAEQVQRLFGRTTFN